MIIARFTSHMNQTLLRLLPHRLVVCRVVAALLMSLLCIPWQVANAEDGSLNSVPGVHFIVLVDGSGSIRAGDRTVMADSLPVLLYEGRLGDANFNPALPRFQAGRDHISLVFFSILGGKGYGGCSGKRKRSSARPDDMFELEPVETATKESFAAALGQKINADCHFSGNQSPILTAPTLVLPFLQGKLASDKVYSKTFIIVATDEAFNTSGSPSNELAQYRTLQPPDNVEDTETANQLGYEVAADFHFNYPPGLRKEVGRMRFYVGEVTPLRSPDTLLFYQPQIQLDRQAESSDSLRLVPEVPHTGDLRILPNLSKNDTYQFRPYHLNLNFQDANGNPWRLGREKVLGEVALDVTDCRAPTCVKEGERFTIPLFEVADKNLTISADDPELTPGKLRFTVGLRYQSRVYDHIYAQTSEQEIEIIPTRPFVLPGVFGIFPDTKLDNRQLAGLWRRDADGLTSQDEASDRLLARRNWYWGLTLLTVALLVAAVLIYLYLTQYMRPFEPRLEWRPADEVAVDFNRPAASHLLAGVLEVVNRGAVPWFGRLWHNEEQPTRDAVFTLRYDINEITGLKVSDSVPFGFVRAQQDEKERDALTLHSGEAISHGKQIFIFFAAESILDYIPPDGIEAVEKNFPVNLSVLMKWGTDDAAAATVNSFINRLRVWLLGKDAGALTEQVQCQLTLKPEEPRKPVITYAPAPGRLNFIKDGELRVGDFLFNSQADHAYARQFVAADYAIQAYRDNQALGGEPLRLAESNVIVPPRANVAVPVLLKCDGRIVPNPDPVNDTYTFRLIGDFDAASETGPHTAVVHRDPTRGEAVLKILRPAPAREIYWSANGELRQRLLAPDGTGAGDLPAKPGEVWCDAQEIEFDDSPRRYELLRLEVGNSAAAGRGFVEVQLTTDVMIDADVRGGLQIERPGALLDVYDFDAPGASKVLVNEGNEPQLRTVKISPSLISHIQGAVVPAENFRGSVRLKIYVRTDQGEESRRELNIVMPIRLEKMPNPNWLCIDYGTSAIAAAFGTGAEDQILPIPLQDIKGRDAYSLAEFDVDNMERGNRYLLPSWIICDADKRESNGQGEFTTRPGFPGYLPASLEPGDPAFIALPATQVNFETDSDRIIYSIKSWLGKSAQHIHLPAQIRYKEDGVLVTRNTVPLEKAVESSFAALIEAYLLAEKRYRADQIIICHPNTFTRYHKEKLHRIAFRTFRNRFDIQNSNRVHLISESDAVAYYHCAEEMKNNPRSGTERLLVYDFGAGTLDLSLIRIEWEKEPICYITDWEVLGRIGVPIAGNYIDEILARLIHRLLREHPNVSNPALLLSYNFPLVGTSYNEADKRNYRKAVLRQWRSIRRAKHSWDGNKPLTVVIGNRGDMLGGVVSFRGSDDGLSPLPKEAPPADEVGVWLDGNNICLTIPKGNIHDDDRMSEFHRFVTKTVIDELLNASNVKPAEVDTVVVSGRGALWPGLRHNVLSKFPTAYHPNLIDNKAMKNAVVQGAIARQDLKLKFKESEHGTSFKPRLGVLINHNQDLFTEEKWGEPIPLMRSPQFRIVQVNLQNPNPREDMKSLRKHFYIDLDDQVYSSNEQQVYIKRGEERDGKFELFIEDGKNPPQSIFGESRSARAATSPPWPVGSFLLKPGD